MSYLECYKQFILDSSLLIGYRYHMKEESELIVTKYFDEFNLNKNHIILINNFYYRYFDFTQTQLITILEIFNKFCNIKFLNAYILYKFMNFDIELISSIKNNTIQYITLTKNEEKTSLNKNILLMIKFNCFDFIYYFYDTFMIQMNDYFKWACENGYLKMAKFLYKLEKDFNIFSVININENELLKNTIKNNHLEVTQWLCEINGNIDIKTIEEISKSACLTGNLNIIQWLYDINNFNIHFNEEYLFRHSCKNGHIKIATWLLKISLFQNSLINFRIKNDDAFLKTCVSGNLNTAKWLFNLGIFYDSIININVSDDAPFRYACSEGYFELAKWLYNCSINHNMKININVLYEYPFRWAFINEHYEILFWLIKRTSFNFSLFTSNSDFNAAR